MPKYHKLSSRDVEKILLKNGFVLVSQKGSHRQFKVIVKGRKRRVTVLAARKNFHPKTLKSMIRQLGLSEEDFLNKKQKIVLQGKDNMCWVCGIYGLEDKELVKKMCQTIVHRGPDDHGIYTDSIISLGHRRLNRIDLKTGHQPIHNEDENVWVILNGEIYNFRELRESSENKHEFYTNSDTAVLVHLHEEYGARLVETLNGMFSFDERRGFM